MNLSINLSLGEGYASSGGSGDDDDQTDLKSLFVKQAEIFFCLCTC